MAAWKEVYDEVGTIQVRKKTRAEVLRDRVKIRLAQNEAGLLIERLLRENGVELAMADWSQVFPHWLIATVEDDVIGCVQVMPSKPVGYLNFLYVSPAAPFKYRAIAMRKLLIQGMSTMAYHGAQYVAGNVSAKTRFRDVLEKLNFVNVGENLIMLKRLTEG